MRSKLFHLHDQYFNMVKPPSEFYSEHAEEHGEKHPLDYLPEELKENLERFENMLAGERVLVPGCGAGRDVEYFSERGLDVRGSDIAEGMVEEAGRRTDEDCFVEDMRDMEVPDSSFEGVWSCACIYFLPKKEMSEALDEFSRALREEGVLYIDFKTGPETVIKEEFGDAVREYRLLLPEIKELLDEAGFHIIDSSTNTSQSGNNTFANFLCRKK